jgi:hypothetical protein
VTTIYGEDGRWLRNDAPIGGSEPEPPLRLNLADLSKLTSGFALRDDDEWRRSQLRDLAECHHCDVASLPPDPIAEFLDDVSPAHS